LKHLNIEVVNNVANYVAKVTDDLLIDWSLTQQGYIVTLEVIV